MSTKDSRYAQTDYSQSLYRGDEYLDPMYLELAYLDPNVYVEQTAENEFKLTDVTTGDVSIVEREPGGGLRSAANDDKSAFAEPTDRSMENDFGYGEFSLGKVGDTVMGAMARTGLVSPTGLMGNTHQAINNVNKNKAVEQARQAMSLSKKDMGTFGLGNLKDPRGAVANMQIGEETYSVAIGGVKQDILGRPTISVQEALDLSEQAKAKGLTVRELSVEESKIRDKIDQNKGLAKDSKNKGLMSRAAEVAKDTVVGALTGNPTKGVTSAISQTAQAIGKAVAPSVKDIARSVVGNPSANTQSTISGAYGTSPMSQAAQERAQQQQQARSLSPQTAQERALPSNELGVESPKGFTSPLGALGSRTTSSFGARSAPSTGKGTVGSTNHKGIDLSTPAREAIADTTNKSYAGAPLSTPGAGTVTSAGYQKGYGYTVDVSHPGGWTSKLSHMAPESITVSVGDQIAAGTPVGQMGTTGNSQAAHAHLEMRDPLGNLVDPATVIDFDTRPSVATPTARPSQEELDAQVASNPSTSPTSMSQQSLGMQIGMSQEETLGGIAPSNPTSVATNPNAYGMMQNLDNITAPSTVSASIANLDPTSAMKSFSPSFADVVSPSTTQTTSVSPTSINTMADLSTPSSTSPSTPGRNAHNSYSNQDLGRMGFAMAGELSPGSLKGLQANEPQAVKEALGIFSSIDNRVQSLVERGVPLSQAIDSTLTGTQYNSLMAKNTPTTAANYSQYGTVLGGLLADVNIGKTSIPADLANVTHYANLSLVDPSWAKTPEALATSVAVGAHTFSTPDKSFSHKAMSTPADETTSVSTTSAFSGAAQDTAKGLGMNDTTPGAAGLGATSRDAALGAATKDARDSYGSVSRGLGGLGQNMDSRMGTQETGTSSNQLGGGLGFGGGYVGAETESSVSPSTSQTGTEANAGFGGVSGAGSQSRGGTEGKGDSKGSSGSSSGGSDKGSSDSDKGSSSSGKGGRGRGGEDKL